MRILSWSAVAIFCALVTVGCADRAAYAPFDGARARLVDEFDEYDELFDEQDAVLNDLRLAQSCPECWSG